jgi:NhaA family Na+:H+ antiporter
MAGRGHSSTGWRRARTRAASAFAAFDRLEASGGLVLMVCSAIALVWANSPWAPSYFDLAGRSIGFDLFGVGIHMSLLHWVNDGLMAVFFFVVGLEIKRELTSGELASLRTAALPAAAALGGLAVPALVFAAMVRGGEGSHGWGVPIATDIAFSLAVLSFMGKRVPTELKVFLTALAIVDDIGALGVIGVFYSASLNFAALGGAALVVLALFGLSRGGVRTLLPYAAGGIVLWLLFLSSGVHATIAGVLLAMCIPNTRKSPDAKSTPLEHAEHSLHPWTTYLVIPAFGLLNAGIALGSSPFGALGDPVTMGVVLGLLVGKPIGILGASWVAIRLGIAELPAALSWRHLTGAACLAGIGFTMSIFIAELAFSGSEKLNTAKFGVLAASLTAAVVGAAVLRLGSRRELAAGPTQ